VFLNKPVAFISEYEKMTDREGQIGGGGGALSEGAPLKHQQISTKLYGITSQKTLFFTVINVRISDLKTFVSPNCLYTVGFIIHYKMPINSIMTVEHMV
jgi:hypothetical protein